MCNKKFLLSYATCLGVGNFSSFPGTLGSILPFVFLPLILIIDSATVLFGSFFTIFTAGIWSCFEYEKHYGKKDPKEVIIDEFAAQLLLLILIKLYAGGKFNGAILYIISFVLFRLFDIMKPWPIKIIEKLKGGYGIMLDDIAAALLSFVILSYLASIHLI